jgi:pyruvate dehydrogenase E2 component (dihydrolipoamide acetyltransferase)
VPDIGDYDAVPVIEIHVKPGDQINAEDALVTLESDKATMDVPSPQAGTVKEVKVKVGDNVAQGTLILILEAAVRAAAAGPAAARRLPPPRARTGGRGAGTCCRAGRRASGAGRPARPPRQPVRAQVRARWASTCRACRAPARRAASRRKTCRTSSRA